MADLELSANRSWEVLLSLRANEDITNQVSHTLDCSSNVLTSPYIDHLDEEGTTWEGMSRP